MTHQVDALLRTGSADIRLHSAASDGSRWSDEFLVDSPRLVIPLRGALLLQQRQQRLTCAPLSVLSLDRHAPYRMQRHGADVVQSVVIVPRDAEIDTAAFALPLAGWLLLRRLSLELAPGTIARRAKGGEPEAAARTQIDTLVNRLLHMARVGVRRRNEPRALQRALQQTATAEGKPKSLTELAAAAHCSAFHLARQYKRATGLSLHQSQLQLRVAEAINRLDAGATDLSALALELGFSHHAHFTRTFRAHTGMTPSAYRRQRNLTA